MSVPDLINSGFEFFAGVFLIMNIRRILKDKSVKGVSVWPVAYFSMFGLWNIYYYPFLEQWASFCSGLLVVLVNSIWVGLAIYYSRKKQPPKKSCTCDCDCATKRAPTRSGPVD